MNTIIVTKATLQTGLMADTEEFTLVSSWDGAMCVSSGSYNFPVELACHWDTIKLAILEGGMVEGDSRHFAVDYCPVQDCETFDWREEQGFDTRTFTITEAIVMTQPANCEHCGSLYCRDETDSDYCSDYCMDADEAVMNSHMGDA